MASYADSGPSEHPALLRRNVDLLSCVLADVIDFEEFVKETPKTLRTSLVKLAKSNGHDLGFLA